MKSLNNNRDRAPIDNSFHQIKLPVAELSCLPKGNPLTTQAVAKTKGGSPQSEVKIPLLKTTPTQFIEHREVQLVPTWSLHFYLLVSLVQG